MLWKSPFLLFDFVLLSLPLRVAGKFLVKNQGYCIVEDHWTHMEFLVLGMFMQGESFGNLDASRLRRDWKKENRNVVLDSEIVGAV